MMAIPIETHAIISVLFALDRATRSLFSSLISALSSRCLRTSASCFSLSTCLWSNQSLTSVYVLLPTRPYCPLARRPRTASSPSASRFGQFTGMMSLVQIIISLAIRARENLSSPVEQIIYSEK